MSCPGGSKLEGTLVHHGLRLMSTLLYSSIYSHLRTVVMNVIVVARARPGPLWYESAFFRCPCNMYIHPFPDWVMDGRFDPNTLGSSRTPEATCLIQTCRYHIGIILSVRIICCCPQGDFLITHLASGWFGSPRHCDGVSYGHLC